LGYFKKHALIMSIATMPLGMGCTEKSYRISSGESIECQRLNVLFNNLERENIQMLVFFGEDSNEPVDEATFEEFRETVLHLAGCCTYRTHPLAKEWAEYNRLECIREYLEKENIQRIAFYDNVMDEDTIKPEDWHSLWAEVVEPKRIREVVKIFCKAMKRESDRFSNEEIVIGHYDRMQIITDKHKFIIPIGCGSNRSKAIRGVGWTSYELRKRLKEWGFPE
jgi:hypothetical protein